VILLLASAVVGLLLYFMRQGRAREAALARTNADLNAALREVRTLSGLIPICSSCKKVRDDDGYWEAVETYITSRSEAIFSHSICQACGPTLYGEHWQGDEPPDVPSVSPEAPVASG
jgi:type II secretory pathway pseudopilin PulG